MNDLIDSTQRWWTTTRPTAFFAGSELHICDTPKVDDWARMYRWRMCKNVVPALVVTAVGLVILLVVMSLSSVSFSGKAAVLSVFGVFTAVACTITIFATERAHRKPFSVITMKTHSPEVVEEQLEELWPYLDDRMREGLRKDLIKTFESKKNWTPQNLQHALLLQIERYQNQSLDA